MLLPVVEGQSRLAVLLLVEWQSHSPVLLPVVEQLHLRGASVRGVAVAHSVLLPAVE